MVNVDESPRSDEVRVEKKSKFFRLNLNEHVAVELTEDGKKFIHDEEIRNIQEYGLSYVNGDMRKKYTYGGNFDAEKYVEGEIMPKYDGLCEFQLHELIRIFGKQIWFGNPKTMFVGNDIYFKEENIAIEQNGKKIELHEGLKRVTGKIVPGLKDVLKGRFG